MRIQPWHVIAVLVVLVLLFGAKRLPDTARALGRSMRILKAETRGLAEDDVAAKAEAPSGRQPLAADPVEKPAEKPTVSDPADRIHEK